MIEMIEICIGCKLVSKKGYREVFSTHNPYTPKAVLYQSFNPIFLNVLHAVNIGFLEIGLKLK